MNKIVIFFFSVLFLVSCSKNEKPYTVKNINEIKTYFNTAIPTKPDLKLTTKKLYTIDGDAQDSIAKFSMFMATAFDKDDNFYLCDVKTTSIKKFDKDGNFIRSFCKSGNGPGEVPFAAWFGIVNDTVLVNSPRSKIIARFDLAGNFIDKIDGDGNSQFLKNIGNKIVAFNQDFDREKKGMSFNLNIYDGRLNKLNTLDSNFVSIEELQKGSIDVLKLIPIFNTTDSSIYMAESSKDAYKITVFDENGKIVYKINKSYRKLKLTEDELKKFNDQMQEMSQGNGVPKVDAKYKNAIINLYTDKDDNLWVKSAVDSKKVKSDDLQFDVFDGGVFLNTISINFIKRAGLLDFANQIYIHGDRIYHSNVDKNKIDVYSYTLK